jgi:hypothetical protein
MLERDRHRMGAHAVVRDAAGSVEGVEEKPGLRHNLKQRTEVYR